MTSPSSGPSRSSKPSTRGAGPVTRWTNSTGSRDRLPDGQLLVRRGHLVHLLLPSSTGWPSSPSPFGSSLGSTFSGPWPWRCPTPGPRLDRVGTARALLHAEGVFMIKAQLTDSSWFAHRASGSREASPSRSGGRVRWRGGSSSPWGATRASTARGYPDDAASRGSCGGSATTWSSRGGSLLRPDLRGRSWRARASKASLDLSFRLGKAVAFGADGIIYFDPSGSRSVPTAGSPPGSTSTWACSPSPFSITLGATIKVGAGLRRSGGVRDRPVHDSREFGSPRQVKAGRCPGASSSASTSRGRRRAGPSPVEHHGQGTLPTATGGSTGAPRPTGRRPCPSGSLPVRAHPM